MLSAIGEARQSENAFRAKLAGMELNESAEKAAEVSKDTKSHGERVAERFRLKQERMLKEKEENGE